MKNKILYCDFGGGLPECFDPARCTSGGVAFFDDFIDECGAGGA